MTDSTTDLLDACTQLVELNIDAFIISSLRPHESINHHPSKLVSEQTRDSESWNGMVSREQCCLISRISIKLESFEDLRLVRWSISPGRLPHLLKRLAGTLKILYLSFFQVRTQGASWAPSLSPGLDTDSNRIQTTTRRRYLEMERLENLVVGFHGRGTNLQAELVRCFSALQELTLFMGSDHNLLADRARIHCSKLHSLTLNNDTLKHPKVGDLVTNASKEDSGSSISGQRASASSLILDVLRLHAVTLEDLRLSSTERVDLQLYHSTVYRVPQSQGGDSLLALRERDRFRFPRYVVGGSALLGLSKPGAIGTLSLHDSWNRCRFEESGSVTADLASTESRASLVCDLYTTNYGLRRAGEDC